MKRIVGTLLLASALPAMAEPSLVFGPSPRALDNRAVFAVENLPQWQQLRDDGFEAIVLNPTFLMEREFQRGRVADGTYPARPEGSFLTARDLASLATIQNATGLAVIYEAGIALSAENCDSRLQPEQIGQRAARLEFDQNLRRLSDAGIRVAALNFDGPLLRLIEGSRKNASCAAPARGSERVYRGRGFAPPEAARAALAFMAALRDLTVAANGNGQDISLRLVVNLPNWQIRTLVREGNVSGRPTADLADVLHAFSSAQDGSRVVLDEIVVDYPWHLIRRNPDLFRDRSKHLWNATRRINPDADAPAFGYIVNSGSFAHPCTKGEGPPPVPFMTYRRGDGAIGADCQRLQRGQNDRRNATDGRFDNDEDYLRDTLTYIENLRPDGDLGRSLVVQDGTRITLGIEHLYVQSWGINPISNLWLMEALGR